MPATPPRGWSLASATPFSRGAHADCYECQKDGGEERLVYKSWRPPVRGWVVPGLASRLYSHRPRCLSAGLAARLAAAAHRLPWARRATYVRSFVVEAALYERVLPAHKATREVAPAALHCTVEAWPPRLGLVLADASLGGALTDAAGEGFSGPQAAALLTALARMHAAFWGDKCGVALEGVPAWGVGGYWLGPRRSALPRMAPAWDRVRRRHGAGLDACGGGVPADMGAKLEALVAHGLVATADACGPRTLVHGDFKVNNLFAPRGGRANGHGQCRFVDWQWAGEGSPASDVAHFLCTSLSGAMLTFEFADALVTLYLNGLATAGDGAHVDWPRAEALYYIDVHLVRFVADGVAHKWAATDVDANKAARAHGLDRQSLRHMAFAARLAGRAADRLRDGWHRTEGVRDGIMAELPAAAAGESD